MTYPRVLSEYETLARLPQESIARFGDGELRCAIDSGCTSQRADPKLAAELRAMLAEPKGCLVGIPNAMVGPRVASWAKYTTGAFGALYKAKAYASSFITRPDSAPTIDTPEYWADVQALWTGKDITLVVGDRKSITPEMMTDAASIREVWGPRQHAYAEIDRIEEEIGTPAGTVILCLGATATALAFRLARKGVHALDLGHMGLFMRHAGAYRYVLDDLVSKGYRQQLNSMHSKKGWGGDGHKHADAVRAFADAVEPSTILDYGCGAGTLAAAIPERRIQMYDPGVVGREGTPKPVDLVVCTDVLEHVEPDRLDSVLTHIALLAGKAAYIVVATRPANAKLPNGANAHLIIRDGAWWREMLLGNGWHIHLTDEKPGHEVRFWLRK